MTEKLLKEIQDLKEEERRIFAKYRGNPPPGDPDLAQVQANIMARQTFAAEIADSEELLKDSESKLAKSYITKSKSNKVELLLDILEEIIESGEKAVIFSKYRKLQPILEREIKKRFKDIEENYKNLIKEKQLTELTDFFGGQVSEKKGLAGWDPPIKFKADYDAENKEGSEIVIHSASGSLIKTANVPSGQRNTSIRISNSRGIYNVSRVKNGNVIESKKIAVK